MEKSNKELAVDLALAYIEQASRTYEDGSQISNTKDDILNFLEEAYNTLNKLDNDTSSQKIHPEDDVYPF